MSQDAAKIILDVIIRNVAEQDAALIKIQSLCTAEEFNEYRHMIGKSMGDAGRNHKSDCCKIS